MMTIRMSTTILASFMRETGRRGRWCERKHDGTMYDVLRLRRSSGLDTQEAIAHDGGTVVT
jgi:hypothetical protein